MKELLEFLLKGILGEGNLSTDRQGFEVEESDEDGRVVYNIKVGTENVGLVIGKGGHMIKAIRNILKVRATLEKKAVSVIVQTD